MGSSSPLPTIVAPATTTTAARGKKNNKSDVKNKNDNDGLFAPAVLLAKNIMGETTLNKLRAKIITAHSDVIGKFTETAESTEFGNHVVKLLYNFADKDGNGVVDEEELGTALKAVGFGEFFHEKQIAGMFQRADIDNNGTLDFDEWLRATPKTLKTGLVKLAKKNGHQLGFLA